MLIHFNLRGSAEHNAVLLGRLRNHKAIEYAEIEVLSKTTVQFRVKSMPNATAFPEVVAQELADHHNRLIEHIDKIGNNIREVNTML